VVVRRREGSYPYISKAWLSAWVLGATLFRFSVDWSLQHYCAGGHESHVRQATYAPELLLPLLWPLLAQ